MRDMILVPLARVRPNPWQPRQDRDESHIAALATDIQARRATKPATLGLLQLPAGRLVEADGQPVDDDDSDIDGDISDIVGVWQRFVQPRAM